MPADNSHNSRPDRDRDDYDWDDDEDDRPRRRRARPVEPADDPSLRFLLPVNTSGLAIAAGYAGLFAVLCFPAPIALILGIVALRQLNRNPKLHGRGRAIFAIVMGVAFSIPFPVLLVAMVVNK